MHVLWSLAILKGSHEVSVNVLLCDLLLQHKYIKVFHSFRNIRCHKRCLPLMPTARRLHKPNHDFPDGATGPSGALQLHHPLLRQDTLPQAHRRVVCSYHHFLLPYHRVSDADQRHLSQQTSARFRLQGGAFPRPAKWHQEGAILAVTCNVEERFGTIMYSLTWLLTVSSHFYMIIYHHCEYSCTDTLVVTIFTLQHLFLPGLSSVHQKEPRTGAARATRLHGGSSLQRHGSRVHPLARDCLRRLVYPDGTSGSLTFLDVWPA